MELQLPPKTVINVFILLFALGLLLYGILEYREQRHRSELLAFVAFITTLCLWQLNSIFLGVVTTIDLQIVGSLVFIAGIGPLFLYTFFWFACVYTDNEQWVNRWTVSLAIAHVVLVGVGSAFDPEFMYTYHGLTTAGPVTILGVTFGEWVILDYSPTMAFWVFQLWNYLVTLLSGVILARYMLNNRDDIYLGQGVALGLAIAVPLLSNVLALAGVVPLELAPTDIAVGVTGVMFAVAIFRYRMFRVAPVGRKQVVETMADPVVMVDDENRVVDANRAARALVDADPEWRGMPAAEFFTPFPEETARFRDISAVETEITLDTEGTTRHFDLNIAPIAGPHGEECGYVIVLREVTTLKEREEELDLMRQIQSRVLRHNIRNDLQTVRLYSEYLEESVDGESAEIASKLVEATDGLLSVSEKTRVTEQLIEGDQTPVEVDVVATLSDLVATYRASFPDVTFTLTAPETCTVETIPAMEFAFENLVENAAQHNDGPTERVDITVTEDDGETVVTVADDGPGIPEQELDVVESGEETALNHGTGVGLWAIQWIVDTAAATIEYETGESGTVATVRFPEQAVEN